jgi:hypothetical protein
VWTIGKTYKKGKYLMNTEEKHCVDCYILINDRDSYYASTMLCNNCYLKSKQKTTLSNQTKEERNKVKEEWLQNLKNTGGNSNEWHCNNCGLLIKECDCGDRMLPVPIQK